MRLVQNNLNNKIKDSFESSFATEENIDLLLRRASGGHTLTSSSILGAEHGSLYFQPARRGAGTLRPEKPSKTELNYLKELREEVSKNSRKSPSKSNKSKAQKRASGSGARSSTKSKPIMTSRERYLEETLKKDGIPVKQWVLLGLLLGLLWYQVRSSFSSTEKGSNSNYTYKQKQKQRRAKKSGSSSADVGNRGKGKRGLKKSSASTSTKVKKNSNGESATPALDKKHESSTNDAKVSTDKSQQEKEQSSKDSAAGTKPEEDIIVAPELSVQMSASVTDEIVPEVVATPAAKEKKKKGKKNQLELTTVKTAISTIAKEEEMEVAQKVVMTVDTGQIDIVSNEIPVNAKKAGQITDFPSEASAPDSTSTDGSSAFESDFDDDGGWTTVGAIKQQHQASSSQPVKEPAVEKVATVRQDTTTASEKSKNGEGKEINIELEMKGGKQKTAATPPAPIEEKEDLVPSIDEDAALARMLQDKENAAGLGSANDEADNVWEEVTTKKKKLSKKFQESSEVVVA